MPVPPRTQRFSHRIKHSFHKSQELVSLWHNLLAHLCGSFTFQVILYGLFGLYLASGLSLLRLIFWEIFNAVVNSRIDWDDVFWDLCGIVGGFFYCRLYCI
jgi:hypothetical protein